MRKLYYRILRDLTAMKVLCALVANPQGYEYISELIASGELTNKGATHKNVTKAILMADDLVKGIQDRNSLDC